MDLDEFLEEAVSLGASDLHLRAGAPPMMRIDRQMMPLEGHTKLTAADTNAIAQQILADHKIRIRPASELDVGYAKAGLGRFRVNIFTNGGQVGVVLRIMPPEPMTLEELHLPPILSEIVQEERGLVLITGVTGSGKSTSLAAMINHINLTRQLHVVTVEDPIEYLHTDKKSLITQRQLGLDTNTFATALRAALRQDPDVILIGKMRDKETIDSAILAAETGHLVFSTLHTADATETINRILAVYPPHQQEQVRIQLSEVLKAVVSMRLLPRLDGEGLVPAVEVLVNTLFISECVRDLKFGRIREAMADGAIQYGMQTFDQSLLALCRDGLSSEETAVSAATSSNDLQLQLRGIVSASDMDDAKAFRPAVNQ